MKQLPFSLTRSQKIWGWVWWALQLFLVPLAIALINVALPRPMNTAQLNFVFFCVNFIAVTVLFRDFLIDSCGYGLKRLWHTLQSAFLGFGANYLSGIAIGWLILILAPEFSNLNDQSIFELLQQNYALTAFGTVLVVPVAEELLYRGLIFGSLHRRSPVLAYLVSSLLFAGIHLVGYLGEYDLTTFLLSLLQYLPSGLCLSWAYARSGSILTPILIHIAVNQTALMTLR